MHNLCIQNSPGGAKLFLGGTLSLKNKQGDVGKVKNWTFEWNEWDQHFKLLYIPSAQANI